MAETTPNSSVLLMNIVGYPERYASGDVRKEVLRELRSLVDRAGKVFTPHSEFKQLYEHHSTGDGYYILTSWSWPCTTERPV